MSRREELASQSMQVILKTSESAQNISRPSSQYKDLSAPEKQKPRDKRQRQDREGKGVLVPEGQRAARR